MNDSDRRQSLPMSLLKDKGEKSLEISQVSVDEWDTAIDDCISSAHTVSTVDDSCGS